MNYIINRKSTPIFCSKEPSFFGGAFDDDETDEKNKSQAIRLTEELDAKPKNLITSSLQAYLHDTIESLCGYDIPVFIDGTIPDLKYGDIVECLIYDADDIVHDCFMVVGNKVIGNGLYTLMILKEDLESMKNGKYPSSEGEFSFLNQ